MNYFETVLKGFLEDICKKYEGYRYKDGEDEMKLENGKVWCKLKHEHDELFGQDTDDWEEITHDCIEDITKEIDILIESLLKDNMFSYISLNIIENNILKKDNK